MKYDMDLLNKLGKEYGESYYLFDSKQFEKNYSELITSFKRYYANTNIAYSYKTNYTPKLCKIVDKLGGYAEVVSSMEFQVARKIGVSYNKIYFNGPYKDIDTVEELLFNGGIVNIDSLHDFNHILMISNKNPKKELKIGIRLNFDINDSVLSRFGFDVEGTEITELLEMIDNHHNIKVVGIHMHFASRDLTAWEMRIEGLRKIIYDFTEKFTISFVSLGGGLYGKMHESLVAQFNATIPTFEEYAEVSAKGFSSLFSHLSDKNKPMLLIEPGSALVGDIMKFCSKVYSIKDIRGKKIATLKGSIYNINPTLNKKNPPIEIFSKENDSIYYKDLDFGGFTCIESDYLYKNYNGYVNVGDYVIFGNVGSYSIVLKPPFILPNFPVIDISNGYKQREIIKKKENFDNIFSTYVF